MEIDFVVLWVDGSQKEWIEEFNRYLPLYSSKRINVGVERYRDNGFLKYWFRGVEKFAPWVRKVHLVTANQRPEWINPSCPKLNLVNHGDYIREEFLPLFNSSAIEIGIHKIPGLAEHFVYFNDDFFLIDKINPDFYFSKDGLPKDSAILDNIPNDTWGHCLMNNEIELERIIDKNNLYQKNKAKFFSPVYKRRIFQNIFRVKRLHNCYLAYNHFSQPYQKKTFEAVWEKSAKSLEETLKNRYRTEQDLTHYLFREYAIFNGNFVPVNNQERRYMYDYSHDISQLAEAIKQHKYCEIVLNDHECDDYEIRMEIIRQAFEFILPEKSIFEK